MLAGSESYSMFWLMPDLWAPQPLTALSSAAMARMSSWSAQVLAHTRLVCFAATGIFLRSLTKYSCRLPLTVPTASTALQADQDSAVTSWACNQARHGCSSCSGHTRMHNVVQGHHAAYTSCCDATSGCECCLAAIRAFQVIILMDDHGMLLLITVLICSCTVNRKHIRLACLEVCVQLLQLLCCCSPRIHKAAPCWQHCKCLPSCIPLQYQNQKQQLRDCAAV